MVFGALQGVADYLLTPILSPLLQIPPLVAIFLISVFISLVSVLFQKYLTNQERLKFLKAETKKFQEKIKKHKDNPEKQLEINKKMMPIQGEMMKESMKPALYTMLPFLLLFLWLSAHFAFDPLLPGVPFSISATTTADVTQVLLTAPEGITMLSNTTAVVTDGVARWDLEGDAGFYALTLEAGDDLETVTLVVTKEKAYEPPLVMFSGVIKQVKIDNPPLKPIDPFTIFGWRPGWIWVYIFFSLVMSVVLRKLLKVA